MREETRCQHMGYSFQLTARILLYAPSHKQDSTYHSLCYTSRGALAGMRNSSMGPPHKGFIGQIKYGDTSINPVTWVKRRNIQSLNHLKDRIAHTMTFDLSVLLSTG